MNKIWILGLIILLNSSIVWSENLTIVVVGLFSDQAVIEINKKQRLLKVGITSPEGVTLISANSNKAVLEINGVQKIYRLGQHISSNFKTTSKQAELELWLTDGMYSTTGSVNGATVEFLVDTGATAIALNAATAQRVGLDYLNAKKIVIKTASGTEIGYEVNLDVVQIGDIKLYNVRAMVLDGAEPERALLGMSFLNQLEIIQSGEKMNLKKKF